ncbi:hypothetical protein T4B_2035 [Trichinella pseudospiralis]|uniref:Uncharacterized protein n=1 Tax=Trichinella pseudospiralis TaxID=6337 RepID=A0A0V1GQP3_TRIPS|nr:hypothetical protein T4B_2035 [Trichinella pseudospiralis]
MPSTSSKKRLKIFGMIVCRPAHISSTERIFPLPTNFRKTGFRCRCFFQLESIQNDDPNLVLAASLVVFRDYKKVPRFADHKTLLEPPILQLKSVRA